MLHPAFKMQVLLAIVLLSLITLASSTVQLDIQRQSPSLEGVSRASRRQLAQTLDNTDTLYYANITLGTPPQQQRVHLDTGSSDLWCNYALSNLCTSFGRRCENSGTYDPSISSTYAFVSNNFSISYVDRTGATGNYVKDTISIGGRTLPDFQFGLGIRSTSTESVLGIGFVASEVSVRRGGAAYPNLPQLMVDQGLIQSNAYSLWLNDLDASTGQILFGGINLDKYEGSLSLLPIIPSPRGVQEFVVTLSSISTRGEPLPATAPDRFPAPALLDSGTTFMYLPRDMVLPIYTLFRAVVDPQNRRIPYVQCALASLPQTLDFSFSGTVISVPFNELIFPSLSSTSFGSGSSSSSSSSSPGIPPATFANGTARCILGILPSAKGSPAVLGDTFLRSAYVVYDLENMEIGLAQTRFNSSTDRVKGIGRGRDGVPDAVRVSVGSRVGV